MENRFIAQLEVNKQLLEFSNNQKKTWENEADFVKTLCDKILESDIYKEYMASETSSYEEDRELWRKLYKILFSIISNWIRFWRTKVCIGMMIRKSWIPLC